MFALFAENEGERLGRRTKAAGTWTSPVLLAVAPVGDAAAAAAARARGGSPRRRVHARGGGRAGDEPRHRGLRHAALAWLAEASTARGASSAEEHEKRSSFFSSYVESPLGETYAKNQLVWREGTETDGTMCVVLEGAFDVFMTHEDVHGCKRESAVASLKKGATFGETALRFDGRRPTTARRVAIRPECCASGGATSSAPGRWSVRPWSGKPRTRAATRRRTAAAARRAPSEAARNKRETKRRLFGDADAKRLHHRLSSDSSEDERSARRPSTRAL